MATQAMNLDLIPVDEINSPNEASIKNDIPMVVSDDEEVAGDGGIYDESALDDCSSVLESDSEWGADDGDHNDGGVVKDDGEDVQDKKESALSAANLEDWLFSSSSPKAEDVVSEDDVDMDFDDADNGELDNQNGVEASPDDEIPVNSNAATSDKLNESVEDALSLIKTIDAEKVKQQQSQLQDVSSDKDKEFFEPGVPQLAAAERKMHETRTSKELELEALRNRGLAGRNSRQLKKTINKNLQIQIDDAHRNGNMEWRKIGGGDDSQDEIEIGTMTTGTATSPQLAQQATSPAVVTSPTMAYEQLAMEQHKERDRAKKLEQETMIQNQLHPESQRKAEQKLLEMDFVFGLLVGKNDPPPEMKAATKAAAKIVPNMLTSKKTIYYDPRYPPKVAFIELDEAYDAKVAAQKATEALGPKAKGKVIALQKRYMVRGRVPVLPRKRSNKSRSSDPKSPNGGMTANATISTQPLTPLTATGSASNSVCSGGDPATMKETLAMPTMEQVASPVAAEDVTTSANINKKEDTVADADDGLQPTMSEEAEMAGVLEGPMNTSADELMVDNMSERGGPSEEFAVAAKEVASPKSPKPNLVVNTRSSSTDIRSIRMSKDAELEAIRQRRVAKEKNLGFAQLEAQSASSKAAYEAEQQDLLQRKSGASEFQFSAGRIVNPLDQLYLQQNKQNRSYREIQQKTREEYHRVSPSAAAAGEGVNKKEEEEKEDTPFDEGYTADAVNPSNENAPSEPSSHLLQAKNQSSRQSRYDKIFQKIRPKSKKSIQDDEIDTIWQADTSKTKNADPGMGEEERQRRYDALFQKQSTSEPARMDVKSSEIKFEQLRAAKQAELQALRERGLQHKTSDGKVRMKASSNENNTIQLAQVKEKTTPNTPSRGATSAGLVGFGMFVKKSPNRPSGSNLDLNPAAAGTGTGQAWRACDDASPSRLKHSSLKNKEAEELARLRNQGLAKRGSQNYAAFEQTSRQSQLEYEKAAQDLARRKSQTSEYVFKGTKDINPVDAVYLDHQQWRKDAMKEEKEALGLFNEAPAHVDQEDMEGEIPMSNAKFTNTNGYQKWESGDRAIGDKKKKKKLDKKKKKKFGVESKCGCTIM